LIGVDDGIYGSNALRNPLAVQLTEFYEYSLSLRKKESTSESGLGIPHFQAYKLAYAWWLSDLGYVQRATEYCKTITKIVQSYTKASPYFHKRFLESLRDLEHRCNRSWLVDEDEDVNLDEWNEKRAKFEVVNDIFSLTNIEKFDMELIPVELLKEKEESEEEDTEEEEEEEEEVVVEEKINTEQESPITPASDMMANQTQDIYGYAGYSVDGTNTSSYYYNNSYIASNQSQEVTQPISTDTTTNVNAKAPISNPLTNTTITSEATNNLNNNNMYGGYNNIYNNFYTGYNSTPYYSDQAQSQQATTENIQENIDNTQTTKTNHANNELSQPLLNYVSDVPVIPVSTTSNEYLNSTNNFNDNNSYMNNTSSNDYNNTYDDEEEDLGFGNNSKLSKEEEKKEEEKEEEENDEAPPSPSPSKGEHEKEKSKFKYISLL